MYAYEGVSRRMRASLVEFPLGFFRYKTAWSGSFCGWRRPKSKALSEAVTFNVTCMEYIIFLKARSSCSSIAIRVVVLYYLVEEDQGPNCLGSDEFCRLSSKSGT